MKKFNFLFIALITIIFIGGVIAVVVFLINNDNLLSPHEDALRFKEEHEQFNGLLREDGNPHLEMYLPRVNTVRYMDFDGFQEFFESGTGVFFFGRPECRWCRVAFPTLLEVANEKDIILHYFYDLNYHRDNETPELAYMMSRLHDYLPVNDRDQDPDDPDFDPEWKRITVPHFFIVKDGTVVFHSMMNAHALIADHDYDGLREYFIRLFRHLDNNSCVTDC